MLDDFSEDLDYEIDDTSFRHDSAIQSDCGTEHLSSVPTEDINVSHQR